MSGTVRLVEPQDDGDYHARLALDPPYRELTNEMNKIEQNGDLVAEIVWDNPPSFAAAAACASAPAELGLRTLPIGAHISVTGPYVIDAPHGWAEIHPAYECHELP